MLWVYLCILFSIPGSDIVQWMIKNLNIEDQGNICSLVSSYVFTYVTLDM